MKKIFSCFASVAFCLFLLGCNSTQIEKNPKPIVWDQVTFAPQTIEKSKGKTVWNNVSVSGLGHEGVIEKVTITDSETVVENLRLDILSAKKQVFKNVTGDYKGALQVLLSSNGNVGANIAALPKFNIGEYEGTEEQWHNAQTTMTVGADKGRDLSFTTVSNWQADNIAISVKGEGDAQIAQASVKKVLVPADAQEHPENLVIEGLSIKDLSVPKENVKVERINLDYSNFALKFDVDKLSFPGKVLADLKLKSMPETVTASIKGDGKITDGKYAAQGSLDVNGLLDLQADVKGMVPIWMPQSTLFELKDKGIVNALSSEEKAQLVMLTMFFPPAQDPVMSFLTKPGQTLEGSVVLDQARPEISLKVK